LISKARCLKLRKQVEDTDLPINDREKLPERLAKLAGGGCRDQGLALRTEVEMKERAPR